MARLSTLSALLDAAFCSPVSPLHSPSTTEAWDYHSAMELLLSGLDPTPTSQKLLKTEIASVPATITSEPGTFRISVVAKSTSTLEDRDYRSAMELLPSGLDSTSTPSAPRPLGPVTVVGLGLQPLVSGYSL